MSLTTALFSLLLSLPLQPGSGEGFIPAQKAFVNELFKSGRYFDCIAEARRLQFYEKDFQLDYFIYTCYFMAGQYNSVINGCRNDPADRENLLPSMLLVSQSYIELGRFYEAYSSLGPPVYSSFQPSLYFTYFLRRVEPLVLSGDYNLIEKEISSVPGELLDNKEFNDLRNDLESFRENEGIPPWAGGVMSAIVPGLGQAWSGRILDGILSFVSVVLPVAGGIYMKDNGHTGTAGTLFFFSGLFYAGNIYGGYNSAAIKTENDREMNRERMAGKCGKYDPVIYINFGRIFN